MCCSSATYRSTYRQACYSASMLASRPVSLRYCSCTQMSTNYLRTGRVHTCTVMTCVITGKAGQQSNKQSLGQSWDATCVSRRQPALISHDWLLPLGLPRQGVEALPADLTQVKFSGSAAYKSNYSGIVDTRSRVRVSLTGESLFWPHEQQEVPSLAGAGKSSATCTFFLIV